jgi:hypothetical protein
LKVSIG